MDEVTDAEIDILNERLMEFYDAGYIDVVEVVKIPIEVKNEDEEIVEIFHM